MQRFEEVFTTQLKAESVINAPAAHHRLLWIHPFLDGNGRFARLMSYAQLKHGLSTGGLWSVARGLARRVNDYKGYLANCDLQRRNDLDGRGKLSEESLGAFSKFFLETALDQVSFMESLLQPDLLRVRIINWCKEEIELGSLPAKAQRIMEAILFTGELDRADLPALLGTTERKSRRITASLLAVGAITSASSRSPFRLGFPATLAHRWLPGLFPEHTD